MMPNSTSPERGMIARSSPGPQAPRGIGGIAVPELKRLALERRFGTLAGP
jgi:hypothetical protein